MIPLIFSLLLVAPLQGPDAPSGQVLYSRLTGSTWQIWLRDLVSDADTQITSNEGDKRYPAWTPDGGVIYHTLNQGCFRIRRGPDGDEHVPVLAELWPVRDLAWAPDGKHIAFTRIRTDLIDAANLCVGGEGLPAKWLTQDPGIQYTPSWRPDGKRIAFASGDGWGTYEIETIAPDGSDRRRLTENRNHEFLPAWSPDGASLAFVSDRTGDYEIWTMSADGADPRRLTDRPGLDTGPCWSPDGRRVAYTSARSGVVQVWASPVGGGPESPLVEAPSGARDPYWRASPVVRAIEASADEFSAGPLILSEIGAYPKTLLRGRDDEVELRFRLSHPARASVDIVDESGRVCRSLVADDLIAGSQTMRWDGTDQEGAPVTNGVYRYVLSVEGKNGRSVHHDPSTEPWGESMDPVDFTFDETTGRMRWIQPRAGFARLRTAVQGFPLLRTLLDWTPLEGGEQVLDWDGLDASGSVRLGTHPDRWITLELFSMPRNTILVAGGDEPMPARTPAATPAYPPLVAVGDQAYLEARKPRAKALTPRLAMEFPTATGLDEEGHPIVHGRVPVRVTIAPEDAASMVDALFEVAFYVDLTFFFEDEESTTPMTWMWDTSELPPGPHLLTVNVFSYDGRIACITQPVVVATDR